MFIQTPKRYFLGLFVKLSIYCRVDGICDDSDVTLTNDISGEQDCFEQPGIAIPAGSNPKPRSQSEAVDAERGSQSTNAANLLLSTKVPLTRSEIVGLYGADFARTLNDRQSSTRPGNCSPNSAARVLDRNSPRSRTKLSSPAPVCSMAAKDAVSCSPRSTGFSDATLPKHSPNTKQGNRSKIPSLASAGTLQSYSPNTKPLDQTKSPSLVRLPNHSPTTEQRNQTENSSLTKEDSENCNKQRAVTENSNQFNDVAKSDGSPDAASSSEEEGISKKSIRRFAAISLHESENRTRQARLHSTVASDISGRGDAADGGYWDVSVIEKRKSLALVAFALDRDLRCDQ